MKIDLNDPHNKSIVLSTGFSAAELEIDDNQSKKVKAKKKKVRRNGKSNTRIGNTNQNQKIEAEIIDEEDDGEDHQQRFKGN